MIRHSPWAHHNSTTSAWRSTSFSGGSRRAVLSKNRLDSAHGALWRSTAGFGTDLKIMVPPVQIRVPPLLFTRDLQVRHKDQTGAPVNYRGSLTPT
jgi:hypothetical protein